MNVISEKEIELSLGKKEVLRLITYISETSMSRLVYELLSPVQQCFLKNKNIFQLNIVEAVEKLNEVYEVFIKYMHFLTQKKYWSEILQSFIFTYIRFAFRTRKVSGKSVEDLVNKFKADKAIIKDSFSMLGKSQLDEQTKTIDSIIEFMTSEVSVISFSCGNLRSKLGSGFNIQSAKSLIELRTDWDNDTKAEATASCSELLESYKKRQSKSAQTDQFKEFMQRINNDKAFNSLDSIDKDYARQESVLSDVSSKPKEVNLDDFLNSDNEDDELSNDNMSENLKDKQAILSKGINIVTNTTDVIKEGYMNKKSNTKWQQRFFQIKNNAIYWYASKDSNSSANCILISDFLKAPYIHKQGKFSIETESKLYKFECNTQEEANDWIDCLKAEMSKLKKSKRFDEVINLTLRKKVIVFEGRELPSLFSYKAEMKAKVLNAMSTEKYFSSKVM